MLNRSSLTRRDAALAALLFALVQPQLAWAYIDPNTGGMIFQMLAPLLAMITSAWLMARDQIKALWNRIFRRSAAAPRVDVAPSDQG